ncbi:hypothetical protein LVJ94_18125 [Pendulispora rubella]|uniref:Gram-positive cocci surface proteins LPxTG domain-containing protein n=1 Tax=Pendulispora rubella TaxID=2741070 RepID=A0ABZ2LE21_9BACT
MSFKSSRVGAVVVFAFAAGAAGTAAADQAAPAVLLRPATMLIKDSPNGPANKPVGKQTGAGVMDTSAAADANGNIFMTWTNSVHADGKAGVQGAFALAQLTENGLQVTKPPTDLPTLIGERTYMRPVAAMGENFMISIFASEDNGVVPTNPQAVAWVFDRKGNMLNITDKGRVIPGDKGDKPANLIQLSKQNDAQQYGPHSVCPLGKNADGSESFLVGVQRQNTNAYAMRVDVKMQDDGAAKVTVPVFKRIVEDAQHCRPQVECEPPGATVNRRTRVITSVEANSQPADIGVRAVLFDPDKGEAVASTLIAKSDRRANRYAVQPSVAFISDDVVAIQWQQSANARKNRVKGNGHTGGENLSMLTTLKVPAAGGEFQQLDQKERVAPYQRHAHAFGSLYGGGAGQPAVAVMAGSSTGTGKGLMQTIPIDPANGKIGAIDPAKLSEVSIMSDVANLPARGKRNPQDQGAGFINGIGGLKNPGFGKANGFMPEVATFTVAAVPGLKDVTASNRDSLFLSLVPTTWLPTLKVVSGPVTLTKDILNGPSPTVVVPSAPSGDGNSPEPDPFGNGPDDEKGGDLNAGAGGCSVGATSTMPTGLGALALGMVGALLVIRRKRGS